MTAKELREMLYQVGDYAEVKFDGAKIESVIWSKDLTTETEVVNLFSEQC